MTAIIHATATGAPCGHYSETDTFNCPECGRTCCYCMGADDDAPSLCSNCWSAKQAVSSIKFTDSPNQTETYKRQPATSGKLHEGPPAREVAAMEAPSRSRGEAPTGGALIGYRHNPCRKCGEHVPTPGATICLTCLCQALDDAGVVLKIKDSGAAGNLAASAVKSVDRPQPAASITTYPSGIREFTAPDGATFGRF